MDLVYCYCSSNLVIQMQTGKQNVESTQIIYKEIVFMAKKCIIMIYKKKWNQIKSYKKMQIKQSE